MDDESTSVLVVGGGLAGLSAALFLAWQGVPVILVEKHPGSSPHPRAIGYTPRTMELLRAVGLGEAIPEAPAGFRLVRARVESLAGTWHDHSDWTPEPQASKAAPEATARAAPSPSSGAAIAQDRLEPILRDRAAQLGADLRFGTELTGFEQDGRGVTATIRRPDGDGGRIRADYMIAADGGRSPIRLALGIGQEGRGHIRTLRSVLFRAPLDSYLEKGVSQFEIEQPGLRAFLTTYHDGRWVLMFGEDVEHGEEALRRMILQAIGRSDLPVEILATGRWELAALVAERFAAGRVFLAGDAAHTLPPARGGYGANTGIADAHNLAWKLAAVLSGRSRPALLESYEAERRPVAWRRHQQIFARPDYRHEAAGQVADEPIIEDEAMEFGQLYRSTAVLGAGAELPPALRPDQWRGQPGTRMPHLWVTRAGRRISTLDLLDGGWVLLAADGGWRAAALRSGGLLGIPLGCLLLRAELAEEEAAAFGRALGLDATGACLVRPDGHIAWRAADLPEDPVGVLTEALAQVASAAALAPAAEIP